MPVLDEARTAAGGACALASTALTDPRDRARVSRATLDGCRRGDVDAFRVLFDAYADRVHAIALGALDGHEAAAKDVVQQVFVKLMTHLDGFRGDAEFSTWLYRIVVNACADERRKRRRLIFFSERPQIVEVADPRSAFEDASQRETDRDVRRAVGRLPRAIRMTVLLRYYEGLSYDEIADVMRCSKGTVASRLNRGHKNLARALDHRRDERGA